MNRIILAENWGMFIGRFINNIYHQHYAIQINIPLFDELEVITSDFEISSKNATIIPSNIKHKIHSEKPFVLILINPLEFSNEQKNISIFNHSIIGHLQNNSLANFDGQIDNYDFELSVRKHLNQLIESNYQKIDDRVEKGLKYLKKHKDRVVSLSEIARFCHLSESRFLHLFKSEMKITYRRAQLWYRISQSFQSLFKYSITETAYEFGFTDSAHYSRTFKENFGFSPRELLKNSQFIQV